MKDMFITGGFNCYPAEIERILSAHPAIAQVAVIGAPDERLGEVGKAFIVLRAGAEANAEEIRLWCRANMANYKTPRLFEFIDALPVNPAGKVQKFLLAAAPSAEGPRHVG
jgi:acyl-CoA synthetase (AMP-forming)/AMP-acid ligase II